MSQLPQSQGQSNLPQANAPQQNVQVNQQPQQILTQQPQQYFVPQTNQLRLPQQQIPVVQQGLLPQSQIMGQPYSTGPIQLSSTLLSEQAIKGESRIEYVPYERVLTEYEEVRRQVQVPITKQVTDYYAVQYEVEYIPQIIQEKQIEYVPVERIQERMEYYTIEKQNILPAQQQQQTQVLSTSQFIQPQAQRVQQVQQQQIITQQYVPQAPQVYQTILQNPQTITTNAVQTTSVQPPVTKTLLHQTEFQQVQQQQPVTTTIVTQPQQQTIVQQPQIIQSAYTQQPQISTLSRPTVLQQSQAPITTTIMPQTTSVIPTTVVPQTTSVVPPTVVRQSTNVTQVPQSVIIRNGQVFPYGNQVGRQTLPGQLVQTVQPQQVATQPLQQPSAGKAEKDKTFLERLFE